MSFGHLCKCSTANNSDGERSNHPHHHVCHRPRADYYEYGDISTNCYTVSFRTIVAGIEICDADRLPVPTVMEAAATPQPLPYSLLALLQSPLYYRLEQVLTLVLFLHLVRLLPQWSLVQSVLELLRTLSSKLRRFCQPT